MCGGFSAFAAVSGRDRPGSVGLRTARLAPFHQLDARCDAPVDDPRIAVPMRALVGDEQVVRFADPRAFDASPQSLFEVPAGSRVFFRPHGVQGWESNCSAERRRGAVLTDQPGSRRRFRLDARREAGGGASGVRGVVGGIRE